MQILEMESINLVLLFFVLIKTIYFGKCSQPSNNSRYNQTKNSEIQSICNGILDEETQNTYPEESYLRHTLLNRYDYNLRPVLSASTVTRVAVSLSNLNILAIVTLEIPYQLKLKIHILNGILISG